MVSVIDTLKDTQVKQRANLILQKKEKPLRNQYNFLKVRLFLRGLRTGKINLRKLWNVFLCSFAYQFSSKKSAASPFILSLELWNECNAGCLFCRDKKGKIHDVNPQGTGISKGKMPPETAIDIITQLKDDVLIAVLYTNGEPLLYKELAPVIEAASRQNVLTMIATNGLLFDRENITATLKAGIDFIKIQLGGFTQDIYGIQIRYGEVERLKENIRLLAQINKEGGYGTIILVDYILYQYNRHQVHLVREFCEELGVMMNIRPGNPKGGLEGTEKPQTLEELPLKISCDWLWKAMQVNWNGEILQCCESVVWSGAKPYETFLLGKTRVKDVWNGEAAQNLRTTITTKGRGEIPMCAKCVRRGVCFKW